MLKVFALSPNVVIERSRLLKEVWEDEGVIVTRGLDMFISKLRKKLEGHPGIKLVNVHGKGYRLEVADLQGLPGILLADFVDDFAKQIN